MSNTHLILSCSPRAGGNCDSAAGLFLQGVAASGGDARLMRLREYGLSGCIACDRCGKLARGLAAVEPGKEPGGLLRKFASGRFPQELEPGFAFGCPLGANDDVPRLLDALLAASSLCLVAPVYFYHLPAQLKALLDRMQALWNAQELGFFDDVPRKACRVILIGARQQGEQLFTGSLLSLRYALGSCGYDLAQPLLLMGMDGKGDLAAHDGARAMVAQYAEEAAHAKPCP
ncbi:NAD(P)H-dependent oxidoreductase [Desulfovibrio sp. OttesenSCG-928-G15]|nr:NAD(P)H-dependent oxidoreductase [Desulfovibrio sp. OttesenSCG-928-G15]